MEQKSKPTERSKKMLDVKSIKKGYNSWYFIVEHAGKEYELKMFDFQKETSSTKDSIPCLIEKYPNGTVVVKQDQAPLIAERYKVGGVYRFKVRRDEKNPFQYNVVTPEGVRFFLHNPKNKSYADRSEIAGRIKSIAEIKVIVEEVEVPKEGIDTIGKYVEPGMLLLLAQNVGVSEAVIRWTARAVRENEEFIETRELLAAKSADWLCEAVRVIREKMPWWVEGIGKRHHQIEVLRGLRSVGIAILEQSNLATGATADAEALRNEISACVNKADEYNSALNKMQDKSMGQYIQNAINSLERTGYIYEPAHRLNVIAGALSIDRGLIGQWMPQMLGALSSHNNSDLKREPLRLALVSMLDTYVSIGATEADRVIDIKLGNNRSLVSDVVRALAMLLLLTTDEDDIDRRELMARLCRYSSLYGVNEATRQRLNSMAYGYLLTKTPTPLPFSWVDVKNGTADILSMKTNTAPLHNGPAETVSYDGRKAEIEIKGGDITIRQASGFGRLRDVVPEGLTGWNNFHVELHGKSLTNSVKGDTDNIDQLRRMWREIEDSLFDAKTATLTPAAQTEKKPKPGVGDEVMIRISGRTGTATNGSPIFRAVITDDNYEGEGTISTHDIVYYKVTDCQESDFMDSEGRPLILRAKVARELPSGKFEFTMKNLLGQFVSETVQDGDEVMCRMVLETSNGSNLMISDRGYSIKVAMDEDMPALGKGDVIMAEVTRVYPDGNLEGVFVDMVENQYLRNNECMHNLLDDYAESVYEPEDEETEEEDSDDEDYASQAKDDITRSELHELLSIIDRQSTLATKRAQSFNLLAIARIIALSMDEIRKAEEYHDRMTFIHLMQQYAVNQWIDTNEFEEHYKNSKALIACNPDIQEQVMRLFCISRMDKDGSIGELAKLAESRSGALTAEVANLVMAYNALKAYEMDAERKSIRNKINELLGIETRDVSHLDFMGEEGPLLEFKTSLVFPPDNNQRPNKEAQCKNLLTEVCGMMNSKGGRLLVGVNDLGYAVGLATDFKELSGARVYDEQKARDLMRNFFVNTMRQCMPHHADMYLDMDFEDHKGKTVFAISVKPSKETMSVDGIYYRRVGSTNQKMDDKERKDVEALKSNK